ncbi:alpha/beta fold hydrolase [Paenibacillus tarimensis]
MTKGNVLWIGGWSMSCGVFDKLRQQLQDYGHLTVQFEQARTSGEFVRHARMMADRVQDKRTDTRLEPMTGGDQIRIALPHPGGAHASPIDASQRKPLVAVGWSLGGLVAQRLAAEGRADALVLLGSTARFVRCAVTGHPGWPERHVRQMASALEKPEQRDSVLKQFNRLLFTEGERGAGLNRSWPQESGWPREALASGIHYLLEEDTRPLLPGLSCPVLIVHGSADMICPWGAAEYMHAAIPDSTCLRVDQAGHVPFLGREREIADAIRSVSNACTNKVNPAAF